MTQAVQTRPDTRDMVIVHRVFTREFGLAPSMVRAVGPGDRQRSARVAKHLAEIASLLHHHHTGEDDLVWPRLLERAPGAAAVVARMEEQHEAMTQLLHEVEELTPSWGSTADGAERDRLATSLDDLAVLLRTHLVEEERDVLPLCGEHMTAAEWAELGERGMAGVPKPRLLVILGYILEECSPEERTMFLSHVPAPARLAYRTFGRRSFEREVADLRLGLRIPSPRSGE